MIDVFFVGYYGLCSSCTGSRYENVKLILGEEKYPNFFEAQIEQNMQFGTNADIYVQN